MTFSYIAPFESEYTGEETAKAVVETLKERGMTIALAESCTGGLIAKMITDISGASNVFHCGVVSYSEDIKQSVLGVTAEALQQYSVVSPQVAAQMADGVRSLAGADIGVGVTGVAGPGPDGSHPEGEIYIGLSTATGTFVYSLMTGTLNAREENRNKAAGTAFGIVELYLKDKLIVGGNNG
ncbi:MAG: nicotinamide-nucleotide amidohydrolase family protein [Clostridia bacterium]|nr:nicotinamide-nucleotide amidohydrolase family protein [Clostridia bacterium]